MNARCRFALFGAVSLATLSLAVVVARPAAAAGSCPYDVVPGDPTPGAVHADVMGTNVAFTCIAETSTWGDPDPLFGTPSGSGDSLLFFPANFTATAIDANGSDQTGSQLQVTIEATAMNATLDTILIDEYGDYTLLGPIGSSLTNVYLAVTGYVTILEIGGIAVSGPQYVFGFDAFSSLNTTVSPGGLATTGISRTTVPPQTGLWSAHVSVDLASTFPNVTRAVVSLDNDLYVYSEADGNTAKIQKKVEGGPAVIITVVPEPGTFALLCGGLMALSLRGRSRRS